MINIRDYNGMFNAEQPMSYAKLNGNASKIQNFAEYLHKFLPVIEEEFYELQSRQEAHPNEIFPIKMEALAAIYKAEEPLYKWYVENAKRQA